MRARFNTTWRFALWALISTVIISATPHMAFAQEANDIARNIVASTSELPGLITALAYLLGLLLGIRGIFKLKEHSENPQQVKLMHVVGYFLIGGALFSLPIVYQAMETLINGGQDGNLELNHGILSRLSGWMGQLGVLQQGSVNAMLNNFVDATKKLPGLLSALAYLTGLFFGIAGLFKLKEHMENPDQNPLKEGIVRLVVGGAMFALPTIYQAANVAIAGEDGMSAGGGIGGFLSTLSSLTSASNMMYSSEADEIACSATSFGSTAAGVLGRGAQIADDWLGMEGVAGRLNGWADALGPNDGLNTVICQMVSMTNALPSFLSTLAYMIGLVFGYWGLVKIKDHVQNPQQISISEPITRLLAAGGFFALPYLVETARTTVTPGTLTTLSATSTNTGFNEGSTGSADGGGIMGMVTGFVDNLLGTNFSGDEGCQAGSIDAALNCLTSGIFGPLQVALNAFAFIAGMILIMVAISRVVKSAQEGAKGPLGFGTIMTFITGGALISFNAFIRAFSGTLFGETKTRTHAELLYTDGIEDTTAIYAVINSVLKIMILVGLISLLRGIFIIRDYAEGNQQASLMAGSTHLIGGALAMNLGPLLNALQGSLGVAGIIFS